MLISLTNGDHNNIHHDGNMSTSNGDAGRKSPTPANDVNLVGGKAASLMRLYGTPGLSSHVPRGFALTVDFFREWVDYVLFTPKWKEARDALRRRSDDSSGDDGGGGIATITGLCDELKTIAKNLPLGPEQGQALRGLKRGMEFWRSEGSGGGLAAVRSSAPDEDGTGASFAGAFVTKLGVTESTLEDAVRECFASVFDYRVFSYYASHADAGGHNDGTNESGAVEFAVVVMEMIDSCTAGVAFSANPLNSDLDEMVVGSSWGLGESVVDGTVEADRFIWDKVGMGVIEKKLGSKVKEKRLKSNGCGGVDVKPVEEERRAQSTLSDEQLAELARLVCLVESTYEMPMDVEWAYAYPGYDGGDDDDAGADCTPQLKLLQARPITTTFRLDEHLITKPGEPRILYYDFNIASEATTTSPFTRMDITLYSKMCSIIMGAPDLNIFPDDPRMLWFNSCTRQYANMSLLFKFITPQYCSNVTRLMDPYLADTFDSEECNRERYRLGESLPKEMSLRGAWNIMRQFPLWQLYRDSRRFAANPKQSKEEYMMIVQEGLNKVQELEGRGVNHKEGGLQRYREELFGALIPSFMLELAAICAILPLFKELDTRRRESQTTGERDEYDALCGGYEGDELMETNIAMYRLARKLPASVWSEYQHGSFAKLAKRIEGNLDECISDLPQEFLTEWISFMANFGYDGQDQMFVSSARYVDSPEILLAKLRHSVGDGIKDPAVTQQEQLARRRKVMALHETEAAKKWFNPFALSKIKKRNATLDNLMWMRNAPKLHMSRVAAAIRAALLEAQGELIRTKRLEEDGDIFHLTLEEVDTAMEDKSADVKEIVTPRKIVYERAKKATVCPMLVDSRCRILKPSKHLQGKQQDGILVGSAISPGVATGKVRVVHHTTDPFERGEVLVAIVTDPAWTPLFVGASAVILQIGGVLQHGALCAREYGKPAVSGIDVVANLKTGMIVMVDGNTGIVKILNDKKPEDTNGSGHVPGGPV